MDLVGDGISRANIPDTLLSWRISSFTVPRETAGRKSFLPGEKSSTAGKIEILILNTSRYGETRLDYSIENKEKGISFSFNFPRLFLFYETSSHEIRRDSHFRFIKIQVSRCRFAWAELETFALERHF